MSVTVVIPIGSFDHLVEPQLRAVLAQELDREIHVVLSVNSVALEVRDAVDALVAKVGDPRVHAVDSSDVRSASHARNAGVAAAPAGSDLLAFCDADDLVEPGWLRELVAALGDQAAVSGRLIDEFPDPRMASWRPPATPGELPKFLGVPYLLAGNMLIRRDAFDAVGGFDTTLVRCEDIAIGWALLRAGYRIGYAQDAVVHYRHRAGVWPLLRQHELYGRGMSQVLLRYGIPDIGGGATNASAASLMRPNGQRPANRSVVSTLRRVAIGIGRVRGIAEERLAARRRAHTAPALQKAAR